jgi:hypothetical protein
MEWQLRIYTIRAGELDEWIHEWRTHVAPLRRRLGFEVLGPWVDHNAGTFVWLLGYAAEDGFAAADARYYDSPERRAIEPDPARHIENAEHRPLRDLGD